MLDEKPTVIWHAKKAPNALSTYEAHKMIDQISALRPERFVVADPDRDDLLQILNYARRRRLEPALRFSRNVLPEDIETAHRNGVNRVVFRIDSASAFIGMAEAMQLAAERNIDVQVETLVSRRTIEELPELAETIALLGATTWLVVFPIPPLPAGTEMITAVEAERVLAALAATELTSNLRIFTLEAPHYVRFGGHAIRDVAVIAPNGQVRPSESPLLVRGNIRYRALRALVSRTDPVGLRGKCGECEFRDDCGGSRARAYAMTGDALAPDPLCSYQPFKRQKAEGRRRKAEGGR
jgi:MoaA/NifB/PqqE/SkfB family radical SAM enzyme